MGYTNAEIIDRALPYAEGAKGICWDGCHKIYILMDEAQVSTMRDIGYDIVIGDAAEMAATVTLWYTESCGLRFINAIKTVSGNPNAGFTDVIAQFEDEDDEEETHDD